MPVPVISPDKRSPHNTENQESKRKCDKLLKKLFLEDWNGWTRLEIYLEEQIRLATKPKGAGVPSG